MTAPAPLDVFGCPLQGVRLIEASAGTGKTWNICGLYLRLLLERGLEVQQVLVVTFTNAATAELRERLRARLVEVLAQLEGRATVAADPFTGQLLAAQRALGRPDEDMRAQLTRALRSFDEAAIFTIHGFCKRALDDAPFAAGLPLVQELVEDDSELRHEVANDFWRAQVAGAPLSPALAGWLLAHKESPQRWAGLLRRHAAKPLSQVLWPEGTEAPEPVDAPPGLQAAFARALALWQAQRDDIVDCVRQALPRLNGVRYKEASLAAAQAQWDEVFAGGAMPACPPAGDKLGLLAQDSLKPKKNQAPCEQHEFFLLAQHLVDGWAQQEGRLERARMHLVRQLVEQGPVQLRERKRHRRVVAFDDMLQNLHERLAGAGGNALAAALRRRFPAALIDEFQDTDPLQFAIFERVYAGAPDSLLFLVGDPKQAIYSFRNADLHTYLRARKQAEAEYSLLHNQRSTPELLRALNALFGGHGQAFMLPGLAYRPVAAGDKPRKALRDATEPRAPLQLWELPAAPDGAPLSKAQARARAVRACAAEIARLLEAAQRGALLHDGRALQAGEIAVLVRSHKEGSAMREALLALGVGSVELRQTSVFQTPDAAELEAVLVAVSDPGREPFLRAALATELLGMDAAGVDALSEDEPALLARIERFDHYRLTWLQRGVAPMLRELVAGEGVHARMLRRPDGERRLTNLRHLAELLHEAAQDHPGDQALLRWLQRQRREADASEATQVRLESDRHLVQIVTIHKSKGLEYPVVFCPFLWDGSAGGNGGLPGCEYHDEAGRPVIDYRDVKKDGPVQSRIRAENDAERLRLVYVALTRAVHRCYLVVGGYGKKAFNAVSIKESARNPLHWLVAGERMTPEDWAGNELKLPQLAQAWAELARRGDPVIALQPLPDRPGRPVVLPRPSPERLAALPPPAAIPPGWRIGSYSALAHGVRRDTDSAAADRDVRADGLPVAAAAYDSNPVAADAPTAAAAAIRGLAVSEPHPSAPAEPLPADDILLFPRGARAGECLHALFEHADLADPATWPQAITTAVRLRPPCTGADLALVAPMVQRMLADVAATPLPGALRLQEVTAAQRRHELEFSLSTPRLDTRRLAAVMQRHGLPSPALGPQVLQGYLRGFIDLVFEHAGRFHILDWKSNHLGHAEADYAPPRVRQAMDAQGYHLQYLLYAVAVHRWLQRRLAGYRYEQHFGGVYYLFVRGVRPGWRGADGTPAGVFHTRPPLALVEELGAALGAHA